MKNPSLSPEVSRLIEQGDPEALGAALCAPGFLLDRATAVAIRDRAAANLFSDPSYAVLLSRALLRGMRNSGGRIEAGTRAVAWRCRAEACFYTGRMKEARSAYEAAVAEAEAARDGALLGQILVGRIALLALLGDSREAARLFTRAERLLRRAADPLSLAKLYMNRGNAFYHEERFPEAYEYYGRSAGYFAAAGKRDATWIGLIINQAIACTQLSRIEEARALFLRSEGRCRQLSLRHLEAQAKFNRAQVERLRGDYRRALALLEEAGSVFEESGGRDLATATVLGRAEIYLELGMGPEAQELAHAAGEAFAGEQMALDAVVSRIAEARAHLLQNRPEEATTSLIAAERFYARRRIRPRRATVLLHLARALLALDRPAEARARAARALSIFTAQGMQAFASAARRVLAETHLAEGKTARAEAVLGPAMRGAARVPLSEKLEVWALGGRISAARQRPKEADRRLRLAAQTLEAQRRLIPGIDLRSRAFENQVAVYHQWIRLHLDSGAPRVETVFSLLQASRARGYRERLGARPLRAPAAVEEKRSRLGSLVQRLEEEENAARPDPARMDSLRRQSRALEAEVERALRRAQGHERGARLWRGTEGSKPVRERLRRDAAVLEYFLSGEEAYALVLRPGSSAVRRLSARSADIRSVLESLSLQLETMALTSGRPPGNPEFLEARARASLRSLYGALLEPLLDLVPETGRLIIIPQGFLHQVPFEALHDGSSYIDARWTVTRAPAADLIRRGEATRRTRSLDRNGHASRDGRGKPRTVVVAGVIEGGPEFIESEMRAVASAFPRDQVQLLRDPTGGEMISALSGADIVHLSTHAVFRRDNPAFSRLRMKDGPLFLADLMERRVSTPLVVLSACNTGQVSPGRGDDLWGVAHGMLAAGTRRLVASRWRVHDESTRALMESFYRHLESGETGDLGAALREASRDVRRRWGHPFYWGGFSLYG